MQVTEPSPRRRRGPESPVFRDLRRRSKSVPAVMGQRRDIVVEGQALEELGSPKSVEETIEHDGSLVGGLLQETPPPHEGITAAPLKPGDLEFPLKSPFRAHDSSMTVSKEDYGTAQKALNSPTFRITTPSPTRLDEGIHTTRTLKASIRSASASPQIPPRSGRRQWSLRMVPPSPAVPATTNNSSTATNDRTHGKSKHVSIFPLPSGSQKTLQSPMPKTHGPPRFPIRAKSTTRIENSKATESKRSAPKPPEPRGRSTVGRLTQDVSTKLRIRSQRSHQDIPAASSKPAPRSRSRPAFSTARAPPSPQRRPHRAITPPSRTFKVIATRPVSVFDRLTVPTAASRARAVSPNLPLSKKTSQRKLEGKPQPNPPPPPKTQFQIWEQRGYAAYEAARLIEKCCFMDVQLDDIRAIRKEINVVFVEMRGQGRKEEVEGGYGKVAGLLRRVVWVMDGEQEEEVVEGLVKKVAGEVEV